MFKKICKSILLIVVFASYQVSMAACQNPAPPPSAFANPQGGSCPSGYYSSGNACVPSSSSSGFAFANPQGGSCPSGYYSSGRACVASSSSSCNAFYSGGGSCPSGYYSSGSACVSN